MAKIQSKFVCQQCGYETSGWLGKCPNCQSWSSLVEQISQTSRGVTRSLLPTLIPAQNLNQVKVFSHNRMATHSRELDRVLGGGLVTGSVVLLSGEPGIGKSTLLLQLAQFISQKNKVFYVSGEESPQQIKLRSQRLKSKANNLFISSETDVDNLINQISDIKPTLLIIDSIQTLTTQDLSGVAGSVGQVRETASRLQKLCKQMAINLLFVGHITKEGTIAGPKVLEHLVDVVLYMEGERFHNVRVIRGMKNRYGPTDEAGILQMDDNGLSDVVNAAQFFLTKDNEKAPGLAVTVTQEGTRPILLEIQALVVVSKMPIPRRVGSGFDFNRLQMLLAVIGKHISLPLWDFDVYLNVSGGFRVSEPACDLAAVLAVISSFKDKPLPINCVAIGEVGLLGEIRQVPSYERRVKEAKSLGFKKILDHKSKNLRTVVKELF